MMGLKEAMERDDVGYIKGYIEESIDECSKSVKRDDILHIASFHGCFKIVKLMIKEGANVNLIDEQNGAAPLHCASVVGHLKIVKLLIKNSANLNITCGRGRNFTPLYLAVHNNCIEVVELLIKSGADAGIKSKGGHTALDWAKVDGCDKMIKLLKNL